MDGWAGGGGISLIADCPAGRILMTNLHFNTACSACFTRYTAKLARRTGYNPGTPFPDYEFPVSRKMPSVVLRETENLLDPLGIPFEFCFGCVLRVARIGIYSHTLIWLSLNETYGSAAGIGGGLRPRYF